MSQNSQASNLPGALNGVRVVEFAKNIPVPTCGLILAAMGAEVIKVEPPFVRDLTIRQRPPDHRATRVLRHDYRPRIIPGPLPQLGEHTDQILAELGQPRLCAPIAQPPRPAIGARFDSDEGVQPVALRA